MKKIPGGFLLVLEGIDGSGKSTLMERLSKFFIEKDYDILTTQEPGGTSFGKEVRYIVQHSKIQLASKAEFLLFAADRAHHIQTIVQPALKNGSFVISDRMADSSMAYQGYGRGLERAMITSVNNWVMENVIPDLVFYVKIDWQIAWERIHRRGEVLTKFEQEKKDFFGRVVSGFDEIFKNKPNGIILDGSQDQDNLFNQALEIIIKRLAEKK
jgi:dTMP kinase